MTSSLTLLEMDGDFIERLQQINLTEEEGELCQVKATLRKEILEKCSLSLLGRFLITRQYNQRFAKAMLRTVWKMGSDLRIINVGDGLFQYKFNLESQLKWVMNNRPWNFDNYPLAIQRWEEGMTAASVKFHSLSIWTQIWGLPFDLITEETGRDIREWIGRVVEVDTTVFMMEQAHFIRVHVEIPLDRPIRRGGGGVLFQVRREIKYELVSIMSVWWDCAFTVISSAMKQRSAKNQETRPSKNYHMANG